MSYKLAEDFLRNESNTQKLDKRRRLELVEELLGNKKYSKYQALKLKRKNKWLGPMN